MGEETGRWLAGVVKVVSGGCGGGGCHMLFRVRRCMCGGNLRSELE